MIVANNGDMATDQYIIVNLKIGLQMKASSNTDITPHPNRIGRKKHTVLAKVDITSTGTFAVKKIRRRFLHVVPTKNCNRIETFPTIPSESYTAI